MALVNCPECGREVSGRAVTCPGCGIPLTPAATDTSDQVDVGSREEQPSLPLALDPPLAEIESPPDCADGMVGARVATFKTGSRYISSDGLTWDGSRGFSIDGAGMVSPLQVLYLNGAGQLLWSSKATLDWFYKNFTTFPHPPAPRVQPNQAPVAPSAPAAATGSTKASGDGWMAVALILTGLSALMSLFYFPAQNDYWPEAVLLSSALQPLAWVGVICGVVAARRGVRGGFWWPVLIWVVGGLLGAGIAASA